MFKRTLDVNQAIGQVETFHMDDEGNATIQRQQDVTDIIEANKAQFNATDERTPWGEGQKVASIPLSIFYSPEFQAIRKDEKKLRAWLNHPDNAAFRTRPGRV